MYFRMSELAYRLHMLYGQQPAALTYRAAHKLTVGAWRAPRAGAAW
jgi:hypothetical protein